MITLHLSNRLERLADRLAEALEPRLSPFAFQTVVVGHRALEFWLRNRFAERWGVYANVAFPLPARFVWDTARKILPEGVPEEDPLSREALTWKLFSLLPSLLEDPDFADLARYLERARDRDGEVARFDLSLRIADLFDRYQYYRPDWLERIEEGERPRELPPWQVKLWRGLREGVPTHRIELLKRATRALYEGAFRGELPDRVDWFFVHRQPPRFFDFLYELARHCELHFWLLTPTPHYWIDLRPSKTVLRRRLRHPNAPKLWEVGHELLASWGREGQALEDLILERLGTAIAEEEKLFEPPGRATLLASLQSDLFEIARHPSPIDFPEDHSLEIHRCHGPLREVQVLRDRLLAAFEELPDLKPEEILVLVPDIDCYAPYIEAVFGRGDGKLPFHLVDTALQVAEPLAEVFLKLLELPESRLTRSDVLSLLEVEPIARRFGLFGEPLQRLKAWLEEAGIAWGLDGDHRRQFLPGEAVSEQNSWRHGTRRLLAGFALGETPSPLLAPVSGVAGQQAAALGAFLRFLERLASWRERLTGERPAAAWQELLGELLDDLFGEETRDPEGTLAAIREALAELSALAGPKTPLTLPLLRRWLALVLQEPRGEGRFFRGGIAFCGMRPLRGIPFRVVALLGMNEADFPRRERPMEFDAMRQRWRHGDPHVGYEDRYLFLESLLAARERLIILFDGRDLRTDDPRPPALMVEQLLEELDRSYRIGGEEAGKVLLKDHPLQPFSRRNYSAEDPESFDPLWFRVARAIWRREQLSWRWPEREAPEAEALLSSELLHFLRHPIRHFLQRQWRLLLEPPEVPAGHEPLAGEPLLRYRIASRLLEWKREGQPLESGPLRAEGLLPHGGEGEALFEEIREEVEALWRRLPPAVDFSPLSGQLELGGLLLQYRLSGRSEGGAVLIEPVKRKGHHLLTLWLTHLLWLLHEGRGSGESRFLLEEGDLLVATAWPGKGEAEAALAQLLELYREGQRRPLPVLPEASFAYAERLFKTGDREKALAAARRSLRSPRSRDRSDPYLLPLLPPDDPTALLDDRFCQTAERLFLPPLRFAQWRKRP